MHYQFEDEITTLEEMRSTIGTPSQLVLDKSLSTLDRFTRQFIERSPFCLLATSDSQGRCDVTPRGDGPGFVRILDDRTLLIPDRPGNKRADSLVNILENPHAGLVFFIPTIGETLRVNGPATIVKDAALLETMIVQGKTPKLAIAVEAEEVYYHCAKALKRGQLWDSASWADQSDLPTLGEVLKHQIDCGAETVESLNADLQKAYVNNLY